MSIKAACHRKPQNKREPAEDSLQLQSARSRGSRGSYLFDREKTSKIKNPSINGHKDDVIPGAEAELKVERHGGTRVYSAKSGKHDISERHVNGL